MNVKTKNTLKILGLFLFVMVLGRITLPIVNSPRTAELINTLGPFGPVLIVGYVIVSHVFAPLAGSPMLFASAAIYGLKESMIYFYIGGMFSSIINFWIARKYGRKWVTRLAGEAAMDDIDNFVAASGTKVLILSRFFGFTLFDFISYASGLTKMSFKKYYFITITVNGLIASIVYQIYKNVDLRTERGITIWSSSILLAAIIFTFLIRKYLHQKSLEKAKRASEPLDV